MKKYEIIFGLNPCSNGILKYIVDASFITRWFDVLILVLMEY